MAGTGDSKDGPNSGALTRAMPRYYSRIRDTRGRFRDAGGHTIGPFFLQRFRRGTGAPSTVSPRWVWA